MRKARPEEKGRDPQEQRENMEDSVKSNIHTTMHIMKRKFHPIVYFINKTTLQIFLINSSIQYKSIRYINKL